MASSILPLDYAPRKWWLNSPRRKPIRSPAPVDDRLLDELDGLLLDEAGDTLRAD